MYCNYTTIHRVELQVHLLSENGQLANIEELSMTEEGHEMDLMVDLCFPVLEKEDVGVENDTEDELHSIKCKICHKTLTSKHGTSKKQKEEMKYIVIRAEDDEDKQDVLRRLNGRHLEWTEVSDPREYADNQFGVNMTDGVSFTLTYCPNQSSNDNNLPSTSYGL